MFRLLQIYLTVACGARIIATFSFQVSNPHAINLKTSYKLPYSLKSFRPVHRILILNKRLPPFNAHAHYGFSS